VTQPFKLLQVHEGLFLLWRSFSSTVVAYRWFFWPQKLIESTWGASKLLFRADFWPFSDISIFLHLRFLRRSVKSGLAAGSQPIWPTSCASCICWSIRLLSLFAHRYRLARRVRKGSSSGRKALVAPSWIASHDWVDQWCCCRLARADAKGLVLVDPRSTTHFLIRANIISTHSGHVRQLLLESLLIFWN